MFDLMSTLSVYLVEGRTLTVPLVWFPRLVDATAAQRANWDLPVAASEFTGPMSMKT